MAHISDPDPSRPAGNPAALDRSHLADAILYSALDCIVVADAEGRIVEFNPAAERVFGRSRAEVLGRGMEDTIVPPAHRDAHSRGMARYLAGGEARVLGRRVEIEGMHASGRIFPVELSITETRIGGERFFVATLRDISEKRASQDDLLQARASLQAIFDNIPAALYLRDRQDNLVMINNWGARFLGRDAADMIGQPMSKFREPQNNAGVCAADDNIARTGQPETREFIYHMPGGDRIGLMTFFPVSDGKGEVIQIGGMLIDVTEHVRAKDQLDDMQHLLASIFDNIPAVLYLRELDGTFVTVNTFGAAVMGQTVPAQMIGRSARALDSEDEALIARQAQATVLTTGQPFTQEYRRQVQGREVVVMNTIFPIRDGSGAIIRIGGFATDVTELYDARNQLQQAQESLHQSEKLAALGQLLAGVAHELNNPLAVVLGRAAILQEKLADTPHAAPLQKLREAANRCARIVKTFLAMARQTGPRRQLVEVNELIESALEMTTYGLRSAGIAWNAAPLAQNRKIEVDQDQIVQVLINLILNAQHAMAGQTGSHWIEVRSDLSADHRWLNIEVSDNGPGVPTAIAHRIFDPFFTTKPVGQGTGLGLSVCKSMIEAHGGKLQLTDTPGGGATFRVTLPALITGTQETDEAMAADSAPSLRGRFLVVDDEVEIAAILADCLAPLGIECVIATDGLSALERLKEASFDAVFCDVSMPGMDGIAFHRRLQDLDPVLARHLVFVSGDVLHRDWDRAKSAADRTTIEKPFDPQQVRETALHLLASRGTPS